MTNIIDFIIHLGNIGAIKISKTETREKLLQEWNEYMRQNTEVKK